MKLPVIKESFERKELCAACGGGCCRSMPGSAMPQDFGDTPEAMLRELSARLATGRWAIDWWEGDPRGDGDPFADEDSARSYYVRPATTRSADLFDPSRGGQCTFHGDAGCEIFATRPSGCRGLEPNPEWFRKPCDVRHSGKKDAAVAWLPYHELILQAAKAAQ